MTSRELLDLRMQILESQKEIFQAQKALMEIIEARVTTDIVYCQEILAANKTLDDAFDRLNRIDETVQAQMGVL